MRDQRDQDRAQKGGDGSIVEHDRQWRLRWSEPLPGSASSMGTGLMLRLGSAVLLMLLVGQASTARASGFIADLSNHLIAITTAFTGSNVLLFGAMDEPGGDVVVVVRGPETTATVRRKSRIGPVWLNTDELTFAGAPAFYAVAASRPLAEMMTDDERERFRIGIDQLGLRVESQAGRSADELASFREALVRNKARDDLYSIDVGQVRFLGDRLFRTTLSFPANVPPGSYQIEVLQVRDGLVVGAQTSVLVISKVGLEAEIFDAARANPAIYGLISVVLAIGAGWTAGALFKKQ